MTMELFRRMRNSTRQLTLEARTKIVKDFIDKLRISGYQVGSVGGILTSGLQYYYRKVRIELEGGPSVNKRDDTDEMSRRRKKMLTTTSWFNKKRRGGEAEKQKKIHGWRSGCWEQRQSQMLQQQRGRGKTQVEMKSGAGDQSQQQLGGEGVNVGERKRTTAVLLVPYTVGSELQHAVQQADDYMRLVGGEGGRVRVIEKGGDKLVDLLSRNDPWAARRYCSDETCPTCDSRRWLNNLKKESRKTKSALPEGLIATTSNQCRREGTNYVVQSLACLEGGKVATYRGESSQSSRQCQKEHSCDLALGVATSPLVLHTVEEHGGIRPKVLYTVSHLEPRPLYRAVRESVLISAQPQAISTGAKSGGHPGSQLCL